MVTNTFLLANNGGFLLQENGGRLIIGQKFGDGGSASNSKSTQKGFSQVKKQLGDRPTITAHATSKGSLLVTHLYNKTRSAIVFPLKIKMQSPLRMEWIPNQSTSLMKIRPEIRSESTLKLKVTKARAYCEMILENPLAKVVINMKKENKLRKLKILYKMLQEDIKKAPDIQVTLNADVHQRGDLMRITTNMNMQTGQIWMRIIGTNGIIVQKAGMVKTNATGFQILVGTRDLKAGNYVVQVSNHPNFSPLGVAEFKIKGVAPISPFIPVIPFLLTPDSPTEKFKKVIFRTMMDSRVDAICKQFENRVFDVDDPNIAVPPLHFNCRCWLEGESD